MPARRLTPRPAALTAVAVAALLSATACSNTAPSVSSGSKKTVVGFVMVGSRGDYGYNQAVYAGSQKLAKSLPDVQVVTADNVPESNSVTQAMQSMVDKGAKVIFATSYGYFPYAEKFAKAHPGVVVVHQGGFEKGTFPANFGTYWGEAFEPVSLGGMAAGGTTKTGKLGYVYAFPISQTIANIDAFELGAQQVNPKAKTYLVNTSNWCDPLKQKEAASALISQGVDVLTQHQDCQTTVIQAAKAAGKKVVGYHYDAKSLDPDGWLTGSTWDWAPVYEAITKSALDGTFKGGKYNANWVGTFAQKNNPLTLASFGTSVPSDLQSKIKSAQQALQQPDTSVFKGPVQCQDGSLLFKKGEVPTYDQINSIDCLVKGVVGSLPKS
ncbi:BMP family ABC transporter substrate-binding protein [Streptomyces sp. NPDC050287]|uniref:BMP family ABC transporter substrate-binding protein n=1 Tax=Streptomyces sp. NPDC050287 TaxID=3365608 RepID=UPI0037ACA68E